MDTLTDRRQRTAITRAGAPGAPRTITVDGRTMTGRRDSDRMSVPGDLSILTDADLLALTRAGAGEAFAELFSRHRVAARRLALRLGARDDADLFDSLVTPTGAMDSHDRAEVLSALSSLPESWRRVLWSLEVEGHTPREVAAVLGLAPNAVSALAYRARSGLRRAYLDSIARTDGASDSARVVPRAESHGH